MKRQKINLGSSAIKSWTPGQRKVFKSRLREVIKHFELDGWDLGYSQCFSDLLIGMLGFNPEMVYLLELSKKDIVLRIKEKGSYLGKQKVKKKVLTIKKAKS